MLGSNATLLLSTLPFWVLPLMVWLNLPAQVVQGRPQRTVDVVLASSGDRSVD